MSALLLLSLALFYSPLAQASQSLLELDALQNTAALTETPSDYWAVEVAGGEARARELADKYDMEYLGQIGNLDNHYHFRSLRSEENSQRLLLRPFPDQGLTNQLKSEKNVGYVQQQVIRVRSENTYRSPNDPKWTDQWSLLNTGQTDGGVGKDLNVEAVWRQGVNGSGVVVSVVDQGLETTHPELSGNYDSRASYDYIHYDGNPTPDPVGFGEKPNDHGTACAGIIAMAKDNSQCGVGVAYGCNIGGVKFNISGATDAVEASALGYQNDYVDVYSNSWGPVGWGFVVGGPRYLTANALRNGATRGRSGKGSIYVFASGNGGVNYDSCAADGFTNSIYTIAIGSADQHGGQADYDEQCAAKMAVTFSYNSHTFPTSSQDTFTAYDQVIAPRNNGGCRDDFTGTSSATPMVSGVVALALQTNPSLTWRDMQYLVAYTANRTLLSSAEWTTNAHGLKVSHKFGFGAVDALAMVTKARTWSNVPSQLSQTVYGSSSSGTARSYSSLTITFDVTSPSIAYLEHVVVTMSLHVRGYTREYTAQDFWDARDFFTSGQEAYNWLVDPHPRRGDIKVDLTTPSGTVSHLLPYRLFDFVNDLGYYSWPFMSVHHWGENPIGRWTLTVTFKSSSGYVSASGVRMKLYGVNVTDPGAAVSTPPPTPSTHHTTSQPSTTSSPSHTTVTDHTHSQAPTTPPSHTDHTHSQAPTTPPSHTDHTHSQAPTTPPSHTDHTHSQAPTTPPSHTDHTHSQAPTTPPSHTTVTDHTHSQAPTTPPSHTTVTDHTHSQAPTTRPPSHTTITDHTHSQAPTPPNHTTVTEHPSSISPANSSSQVTNSPSTGNTVKYTLAGVFSVGGLILLVVIISVVVGVAWYCRKRSEWGVGFHRLQTEIQDDSENPHSISM